MLLPSHRERRSDGRPHSRANHPHRCDTGASALEYALLVAAIAAVIVAVMFGLGTIVRDAFSHTSGCLSDKGSSTSCPSTP